jgi:apolipoprotein N-acyltransferase
MHSVADAIIVLWGWRRFAIAFAAGALSALALPPFSAFPVLFLTMPVLVWLIDGAIPGPGKGAIRGLMPAALVGWAFGFGYFLAGLWWIGAAFLVDADKFAWLLPVAVLAMPAGLALFWALAAAAARLAWPDGWRRILVLAITFTAAEWLRGHVLTGFPWNAFGYTLTPVPLMMQSASLVGLWGLTLAAFIIFAAPALLVADGNKGRRGRILFIGCAGLLLAAHVVFGLVRLAGATDAVLPQTRLRIVQPSIAQNEKWQEEN